MPISIHSSLLLRDYYSGVQTSTQQFWCLVEIRIPVLVYSLSPISYSKLFFLLFLNPPVNESLSSGIRIPIPIQHLEVSQEQQSQPEYREKHVWIGVYKGLFTDSQVKKIAGAEMSRSRRNVCEMSVQYRFLFSRHSWIGPCEFRCIELGVRKNRVVADTLFGLDVAISACS